MTFNWPGAVVLYGVLVVVALIFVWQFYQSKRRLSVLMNPVMWPTMIGDRRVARVICRRVLMVVGLGFVILAMMQPLFGTKTQTTQRVGQNIYIAIDTSMSMSAQDARPSRLELAKREVIGLIDSLKGNRMGLITFAGAGYITCPLTLDYSAVRLFLNDVRIGAVSRPGTNLADAILAAYKGFLKQGEHHVLVLLSDGEAFEGDSDEMIELAKKNNIRIFTIGIGTAQGDPLPVRDPNGTLVGFKKDESGQVVLSKLDQSTLTAIATGTNGQFFQSSGDTYVYEQVYQAITDLEKQTLTDTITEKKLNQYQWPLGLGLVLLALAVTIPEVVVTAIVLWTLTSYGYAATLMESITNQRAKTAFHNNELEQAQDYLTTLLQKADEQELVYFNLGKVWQAKRNPEQAQQAFQTALSQTTDEETKALMVYELARTAYDLNQLDTTVALSKQLLTRDPNHRSAKQLLELALKAQANQSQQSQKKQSKSNRNDQDDAAEKRKRKQAAKQQLEFLDHHESEARQRYAKPTEESQPTVGMDW